mmetsp:Transcript_98774/g.249347  ORF Transcript_98774/g.249347 Transcript_98774/m.249347 type:complete len:408 (+) Transcript_98774:79-1302(+)
MPLEEEANPGSAQLLLLTLNEGKHRLSEGRLKAAFSEVIHSLVDNAKDAEARDLASIVVLARQEALQATSAKWDSTLAANGFCHKVAEVIHSEQLVLAAYSQDKGDCEFCQEFFASSDAKNTDPKGITSAVMMLCGFNIGLGSMHLDGNMVAAERLRPLQVAASTASCAGCDAVLLIGDVNCALEPTAEAFEVNGLGGRAAELLMAEYNKMAALEEDKAVSKLPDEFATMLQEGLATQKGRRALMVLDGCPAVCHLNPDGAIKEMRLVEMPAGSFPTYRLCNVGNAAFDGLRSAGAAAMAVGDGETYKEDGIVPLQPSLEVTADCIKACYFLDDDKGHSGSIKKRGDMCRLNLGWLDRLYVGAQASSASVAARQADPMFLLDEAGQPLDHALVAWRVEVQRPGGGRL